MKREQIIRQLMDEQGMRVSDIAKKSGIAYSTIKSILEKGVEKASYANICAICKVLGITVNELEQLSEGKRIVRLSFSQGDLELLDKYTKLDAHGQELVRIILEKEYERYHHNNTSGERQVLCTVLQESDFLNSTLERLQMYWKMIHKIEHSEEK